MPIVGTTYTHPDNRHSYCVTNNFAVIPQKSPSPEIVKKCSDIWDEVQEDLRKWEKRAECDPCPPGIFAVFPNVAQAKFDCIVVDISQGQHFERIRDATGEISEDTVSFNISSGPPECIE